MTMGKGRAVLLLAAVLMVAGALYGTEKLLELSGSPVFKKHSRAVVIFPHERHYAWGIGCFSCHHRYKNKENIIRVDELKVGSSGVSCASCHTGERELERAYHHLCMGCHEKMAETSISTGPVMCAGCHSGKEK